MEQPPTRVVLSASPSAFCAGVERAIQTVESVLDQANGPITGVERPVATETAHFALLKQAPAH